MEKKNFMEIKGCVSHLFHMDIWKRETESAFISEFIDMHHHFVASRYGTPCNLTYEMECFTNRWDLFHISNWERDHKKTVGKETKLGR